MSSVYYAVQAAAERVPGVRRSQVLGSVRTAALAGDLTGVRVKGKWAPLGVSVDDLSGQALTIDALTGVTGEDAVTLKEWITPVAEQVGARLLITDDADAFKQVAAELGLPQQVCKAHVVRNTEALLVSLRPLAATDADGSLATLGLNSEQAVADLEQLGVLVGERRPEQQAELEALYRRYAAARCPVKGETASLAYRLRNLFLDRWNLWPRLVRYRTWRGPNGETIDGRLTGPTTAASGGLAGGSRSATVRCVATNASVQRSTSVAFWRGAATSWMPARVCWRCSPSPCSLQGIPVQFLLFSSTYHKLNDHRPWMQGRFVLLRDPRPRKSVQADARGHRPFRPPRRDFTHRPARA